MSVNKELLQLTLNTIKENPQHWNQQSWHCGTTHCFAGFAELLAKHIPIDTEEQILIDKYNLGKNVLDYFSRTSKPSWNTEENAANILGITEEDAQVLFHYSNDLKQLEEYVNYLINHGSLQDYHEYLFGE